MLTRRDMLKTSAAGAAALLVSRRSAATVETAAVSALQFKSTNTRWQQTYDAALAVLAANVKTVPRYDKPVLVEGAVYAGVWLECGPHEGFVYRHVRPDIARQNHLAFFALQRPDGQLPASIKMTEAGFGQIQMTVPIAATAREMAHETGDDELLRKAYEACGRWDAWLVRYRNTRGTGLVEGFCTYDTGHDNSPRWAGIPNRCPDADAKRFPPIAGMPRLCPDLSATVYGGRLALAAMAGALGKRTEQAHWLESAEELRTLINTRLYSPADACYYDLDSNDSFIRIRGDLMTRVCGEHVPDGSRFDDMWKQQLGNPHAFWAPYPLPSIALDDGTFVRPIPRNSWGGATQALTALRAPRWMETYGRSVELAHMMQQWVKAISRQIEFRQQMDPLTGDFTQADPSGYSPAALVFFDYTWRLGGPRSRDGAGNNEGGLEWNVRPDIFSAGTTFTRKLSSTAGMKIVYGAGAATLSLNDRVVLQVHGSARILTDSAGIPHSVLGTVAAKQTIHLTWPDGKHSTHIAMPNGLTSMDGRGLRA